MASNGLVTNESKTALLYLNLKTKANDDETNIKIGDTIINRQSHAKLLGMTFQDNLSRQEHIRGKGGLIASLNQRLYIIKRLGNAVDKKSLIKIADSLFNSKVRYGIQLLGMARLKNDDVQNEDLLCIQKIQNKMLRFINNVSLKEHKTTESLLEKTKMLSVNRINAQTKITEVWKALNKDKKATPSKKVYQ